MREKLETMALRTDTGPTLGEEAATVDHWQCPTCLALNSNDEIACSGCGEVIPAEWPAEGDDGD